MSEPVVPWNELSKHASKQSCWIVIHGGVYNLTNYLAAHPGGATAILRYAGTDATKQYVSLHPKGTLEKHLNDSHYIGRLESGAKPPQIPSSDSSNTPKTAGARKPRLGTIINIKDFEAAAGKVLPKEAYAFFKAGADSEYSASWNRNSWAAIHFRPRVLRPVAAIDTSAQLFKQSFALPFFISPAGGGKLAHPEGEVLMAKAAGKHEALQWVCNMAGCTQQEMAEARLPGQTLFWQIYARPDLEITSKEIRTAVDLGYKGFALTVDGVRPGKRERDMRIAIAEASAALEAEEDDDDISSGGISAVRGAVHTELDWVSSAKWLRSLTDLPIAIKGIQSWQDAELCMKYGFHPWLSNHGGRQLEGAPAAADTLVDIREHCPQVFDRCEVIVDGGITRGTDIIKALCLGATMVGIGRPFLYALAYGERGVDKAFNILKQELQTGMALVGATSVRELKPEMVDTRALAFASAFPRPHL